MKGSKVVAVERRHGAWPWSQYWGSEFRLPDTKHQPYDNVAALLLWQRGKHHIQEITVLAREEYRVEDKFIL